MNVHDPLAPLLDDGVVDEIVGRLKSGKEADLWLVRHGGEVIAAKVYKARQSRSFKNDAAYKEGRQVRDSRTRRALERGSRFGQAAAEEAWKTKESDALHALHAAGVRVPKPVLFYEGVLLMEVVVDLEGHPAPRLADAHVPAARAAELYADLRAQIVRMLCQDLIHGDLSPYNVLLGWNGPVVIDFPQVVGAAHNSQAESFLLRDVANIHRFFAAIDPSLRAAAHDGREIWRAYVRRELTPDFVPTGKPPPALERPHGHARAHGAGHHPQRHAPPHAPHAPREPRERREPRHGRPHGTAPRPAPAAGVPHPAERAHPAPGGPRHAEHAPSHPQRGPRPPGRGHPPRGAGPRRPAPPSGPEVIRVSRPPLGSPAPQGGAPGPRPAGSHGGPNPRPHGSGTHPRPQGHGPRRPPHGPRRG